MMLIVDTNEKATNPKVVKTLQTAFSNVVIANLVAGDVNIPLDDGSVLAIERKAPLDFLASIADGRIFEQVENMQNNAKYAAIIVTGYFTYGERDDFVYIVNGTNQSVKTNWKGAAVRNTMVVVQYSGVALIFCPAKRYAEQIAELYTAVNKPDARQAVHKKRIITFPPIDERIEFLAQLPFIGMKHAESILKFAGMMDGNADELGYGTIASALHWISILSQINQKQRPRGWGPEKILTLRKFFGLKPNQYIGIPEEVTSMIGEGPNQVEVTYTIMNEKKYRREENK